MGIDIDIVVFNLFIIVVAVVAIVICVVDIVRKYGRVFGIAGHHVLAKGVNVTGAACRDLYVGIHIMMTCIVFEGRMNEP